MGKDKCECGKEKYDYLKECWTCKEKKEVKEIFEYSKSNKAITGEKYVICPYCGSHYGEDDLHNSMELTCYECEKDFDLEVEYDISYSTFQKKQDKVMGE